MRWAMPSTMAVLPTPGSPMSTGLFFVRRESTCSVRRISSSRPTMGSIFPSRASSVMLRVNFSRDSYWFSASSPVTFWPLRRILSASSSRAWFRPWSRMSCWGLSETRSMARKSTSLATWESPSSRATPSALAKTSWSWRETRAWAEPLTLGSWSSRRAASRVICCTETPTCLSRLFTTPFSCVSRTISRWWGRISGLPCLPASFWASPMASRALTVKRS